MTSSMTCCVTSLLWRHCLVTPGWPGRLEQFLMTSHGRIRAPQSSSHLYNQLLQYTPWVKKHAANLAACFWLTKLLSVALSNVVVGYTLLQIFHRLWQWKNFENRSIFGEDMDKSLVACFWLRVYSITNIAEYSAQTPVRKVGWVRMTHAPSPPPI